MKKFCYAKLELGADRRKSSNVKVNGDQEMGHKYIQHIISTGSFYTDQPQH